MEVFQRNFCCCFPLVFCVYFVCVFVFECVFIVCLFGIFFYHNYMYTVRTYLFFFLILNILILSLES